MLAELTPRKPCIAGSGRGNQSHLGHRIRHGIREGSQATAIYDNQGLVDLAEDKKVSSNRDMTYVSTYLFGNATT
jgi:hypothetical protein